MSKRVTLSQEDIELILGMIEKLITHFGTGLASSQRFNQLKNKLLTPEGNK